MRKYITSAIVIFLTLVFSGCADDNAPGEVELKKLTFSPSIWRSDDAGKNWEVKNTSLGELNNTSPDVLSVAVNPNDGKHVRLGLRTGGIIETVDGGETWRQTIFLSDKVYGMGFDPIDSRIFYASGVWEGRGKVFKTSDGGENWDEIWTASADGPLVIALSVDSRRPSNIYMSTSNNQVLKSEDAGRTWKNVFDTMDPVTAIGIDKFNSEAVYLLSTSGMLWRSLNGGIDFVDIGSKLMQLNSSSRGFSVLKTDPNIAGGIYLAGESGMIRSSDGGETWQTVNVLSESDEFPVRAMAISPANAREIIYAAGQATYKTVDGGETWATFQFNTGKSFSNIEYSSTNANTVYLTFSTR